MSERESFRVDEDIDYVIDAHGGLVDLSDTDDPRGMPQIPDIFLVTKVVRFQYRVTKGDVNAFTNQELIHREQHDDPIGAAIDWYLTDNDTAEMIEFNIEKVGGEIPDE